MRHPAEIFTPHISTRNYPITHKKEISTMTFRFLNALKLMLSAALFFLAMPEGTAAIILSVTSESANNGGDGFHDGTAVVALSGDLLETEGTIADESGSTGRSAYTSFGDESLVIGEIGLGTGTTSSATDPDARFVAESGNYIEFSLDTSANTMGYDISSIRVMSYWTDQRSEQDWTIQLRTVGGSFTNLSLPGTPAPDWGNSNQVVAVDLSDSSGLIAEGIDGIRFNFNDGYYNWAAYREIDVVGVPTIPEPSTLVLAGLGLAGLTIRRRRK